MSLLELQDVEVAYGDLPALRGVSLGVEEGDTLSVVGANGAGKTTMLRAISGLLRPRAGRILLDGARLDRMPSHVIVARGVVQVPEGRKIFPSLSVRENLLVGAYRGRPGPWTLERVYRLFPLLGERREQPGTNLSGGEQQMLAIGRGLMANPRLLLVDEISLGLAPLVVKNLYRALEVVKAEGTTLLVVEQDVSQVLAVAQRVYCLRKGTVALEGVPGQLTRARISAAYFGT